MSDITFLQYDNNTKMKQSAAEKEYDQLFSLIRKMCRLITIWPIELRDVDGDVIKFKKFNRFQRYHRVFLIIFSIFVTAGQISGFIMTLKEGNDIAEDFITAFSWIIILFRLSMFCIKTNKIQQLLDKMRDTWVNASREDQILLRKCCYPAFKISMLYITSLSITTTLLLTRPLIQIIIAGPEERILPYGGYYYIDVTRTPIYQTFFLFKSIAAIYGLANIAGVNTFNFVAITIASAKFVILRNHLNTLKHDDKNSWERLQLLIQEHQRAIEFADIIEDIVNKVILCQFMISTSLICFAGLEITEMLGDKIRLATSVVYLGSATSGLFLFSYSGYKLTEESRLVGSSAFYCDWVGSMFTQNLHILMMRTSRSSNITAGKFYDMSLETFSMVMSSAFSYFTTLRATQAT